MQWTSEGKLTAAQGEQEGSQSGSRHTHTGQRHPWLIYTYTSHGDLPLAQTSMPPSPMRRCTHTHTHTYIHIYTQAILTYSMNGHPCSHTHK